MLGRYRIVRGKRSPDEPLPQGVRQDTRKHTKHVLRPEPDEVAAFLAAPGDAAWRRFSKTYRAMLVKRSNEDPAAFDTLADLAREQNVWLGVCATDRDSWAGTDRRCARGGRLALSCWQGAADPAYSMHYVGFGASRKNPACRILRDANAAKPVASPTFATQPARKR